MSGAGERALGQVGWSWNSFSYFHGHVIILSIHTDYVNTFRVFLLDTSGDREKARNPSASSYSWKCVLFAASIYVVVSVVRASSDIVLVGGIQ